MWSPRRQRLALALLFAGLLAVYMSNGARFLGGDTLGSPYTALSLMRDHDFEIGSLVRTYPGSSYWFHQTPEGKFSILGFGTPLVALPVYAVFDAVVWHGRWTENRLLVVGKLAAALMTALAALLVAITARRFVSFGAALAIAVVFAVCSSAWSISSQALWKHSPAALLGAAGLALLLWPAPRPPDARAPTLLPSLAALPLALAAWCRENLVLVLAAAAVYVGLVHGRRALAWFAAGAAVVVAALMALNLEHFGSPWASAQRAYAAQAAVREGVRQWDTPLWLGLYGMLLSPSRGLLVFSPVFLASGFGLWVGRRDPDRAAWIFVAVAAALAVAPGLKWHWWWGGDNYGPRMSVDATPYLALLIVPAWRHVAAQAQVRRRVLAGAFAAAALFSGFVQAAGAFCYDGLAWDERSPAESVNSRPDRLMSWSDSQLFYYLRWPRTKPDRIPWR